MPAGIKSFDIDPPASDPNGIAEDQQPDTGTPVVLNGAMCDSGTAGQFDIGDSFSSGIGGVALLFESAASWAAVTFTIVGLDADGKAQTATHTGPTTNNTTTTFWSQILAGGITCDGTVATNIEIGAADVFVTKTVPLNKYAQEGAVVAITKLAGTTQFDIQETFDNLQIVASQDIGWVTKVSNASTDGSNLLSVNATAARVHVDSYTDTAEFQATISYNPFR
jgi:hypothetical protein